MSQLHRKYENIGAWSHAAVARALQDDNTEALIRAVIGVSMHDDDWRYAQTLCVRLATHPHFNIRGNAVLGFGHTARVHRQLDQAIVQPIIEAELRDTNDYIRGHGHDAADDTAHFLGWRYDEKPMA